MKRTEHIFGVLSAVFILTGILFKTMRWPGAGVLISLSPVFFVLVYTPIITIRDWVSSEGNYSKGYLILRFFTFFLGFLGMVFKIMHWPGSGLMILFTQVLTPLFLISYFLRRKKKKVSLGNVHRDVVMAVILVAVFMSIRTGSVSKSILDSFVLYEDQLNRLNHAVSSSTDVYIGNLKEYHSVGGNPELESISIIHNEVDSILNYIQNLRSLLIQNTEGIPKAMADTISMSDLNHLDNYDVPTLILIGTPSSPPMYKGYTAFDLKIRLNNYVERVKAEVVKRDLIVPVIGMGMETDDPRMGSDYNTWEEYRFYHIPISGILTDLTYMKNLVLLTESNAVIALGHNVDVEENVKDLKKQAQQEAQLAIEKQERELDAIKQKRAMEQMEIQKIETQFEQQQTLMISVFIGTVLILVLLVLAIRSIIIKQRSNKQLNSRNDEIERQRESLQEKNKEITDSINYANRLQKAILPSPGEVTGNLPSNFILFKPKDVVSGDFYWFEQKGELSLIAVADCTGHGVPGALVSMVCSSAMNRCFNEFDIIEPREMLNKTREIVIETFAKSGDQVKDGMDISICLVDAGKKSIKWAGANNPLWIVKDKTKELLEIKASKQPIGLYENMMDFVQHEIQLENNDTIYLFTDGYADQFGGPKGKKYKYRTFKNKLISLHSESMDKQHLELVQEFDSWKGNQEQIDDVCIIGIRLE